MGVDGVFGDCQPEGLGELVEVIKGATWQFLNDVVWEVVGHNGISLGG